MGRHATGGSRADDGRPGSGVRSVMQRFAAGGRRLLSGDRLTRLQQELEHEREISAKWKAQVATLRSELGEKTHAVLSPDVLRSLLPGRLACARQLASTAEAQARHAAHLAASAAYREAWTTRARPSERAAPATIEGIRWWIPTDDRFPDRVERAERQGLPLRAILQTREFTPGSAMIDIGANIGRTSIPRVVLGDVSVAYAAEPDPDNFACIVRTVAENGLCGLILPEQAAIGSEDGDIELTRARFIGGHAIRPGRPSGRQTIRVPLLRLDSWVERRAIDLRWVSFVKVDVQGWEAHVLRGATRVLSSPHVCWQLEIDPGQLAAAGGSLDELATLIERWFSHFVDLNLDARGHRLQPISRFREALGYLGAGAHKTDVVLFHG